MIKIKICGINDPAAFDTSVQAGADWIGFNFFPPSPRYVTPVAAAALSRRTGGGPMRVGLFVEPSLASIAEVLDIVPLDILQIYGMVDGLAALGARFGRPIWRAVGIRTADDLPGIAPGCERLVLEAKPPAGSDRPGGNATTFDWPLLRGWKAPAPWILAGGLTPDNVASAITATAATAVDVSSGVESRKGVKDAALIRAFIAAARCSGS